MSAPHPMSYEAFVAHAAADPAVVGLVLKGSQAHEGMVTRYSDHDLYVVLADGAAAGPGTLDGFRSARLDVVVLLDLLFALDRRPRPYNKYLEWELDRFPLPGWDTGRLLTALGRITGAGDADGQRELFGRVEAVARAAGHAATLDAWGEDLGLMRLAAGRRVP
ncbi:hypothetical protein ACJ7VE_01460 [Streptomyces sp. PB17]|uniref:hypothetical protein n=1 Tax=Streptomyces sp. PB17 TaxID=3384158 RepID=UPI0038B5854A